MSVYQCEYCQFITMNKSDYNKHIHTMKHLSRISEPEPTVPIMYTGQDTNPERNLDHRLHEFGAENVAETPRVKDPKLFLCSHCNKAYKSKNGLHYHSKKCICGAIVDISKEIIPVDISCLDANPENTKIVGRITSSFDDISITHTDDSITVADPLSDYKEEYIDEAFHMGIILDLFPEDIGNMTEIILYPMVGFVVCIFIYVFVFVPV
jgi:hypothetical protein